MELISSIWNYASSVIGTIVLAAVLISILFTVFELLSYKAPAFSRKSPKGIAIITGASSGLGREYAKQLSKKAELYNIKEFWLLGRKKEELLKTASCLALPAQIFPFDLENEEALFSFESTLREHSAKDKDFHVSLLLNCAGFGKHGSSRLLGRKMEQSMTKVNVLSVLSMTHMVLPYMKAKDRIVNLASVAGFQPIPYLNCYAASKAFVYSYSRALRSELLKQKISVTTVAPYWIYDTSFIKNSCGKARRPFMASKTESVVRLSLRAVRRRRALSTPGILCSVERIFAGFIPDNLLAWLMTKFL